MTDITKEVIKDAKAVGFKFNWNQEYVFPPSPLRTEQLTKFAALQRQREAAKGEVVVTTNRAGEAVAVTMQDSDGRILSVIWEREAIAAQNNNWKDKLATIVDIYFDGIENEPYERAYVAGSFSEQMHELHEMFRLEDSLSAAPTPEQKGTNPMTTPTQDEKDLKAFKEENIVIPNNSIGVTFLHYGKECTFLGWKAGRKSQREANAKELAECQAREAKLREALIVAQDYVIAEAQDLHERLAGYLPHKHNAADANVALVREALQDIPNHSALDQAIAKAVENALKEFACAIVELDSWGWGVRKPQRLQKIIEKAQSIIVKSAEKAESDAGL